MDSLRQKELEQLAQQRLEATADDDEQWSFCFRTEGSAGFTYCPWSETADLDFDGNIEGLSLPWSPERRDLISSGQSEPNDEELRQWREAECRQRADFSDRSWSAWIVPLKTGEHTDGYALFVGSNASDPDKVPILEGVFDTFAQAVAALSAEGPIAGWMPGGEGCNRFATCSTAAFPRLEAFTAIIDAIPEADRTTPRWTGAQTRMPHSAAI